MRPDSIILRIMGWLWPPLGLRLFQEEMDRQDRIASAEFYIKYVVPRYKKEADDAIRRFHEPSLFCMFINTGEQNDRKRFRT